MGDARNLPITPPRGGKAGEQYARRSAVRLRFARPRGAARHGVLRIYPERFAPRRASRTSGTLRAPVRFAHTRDAVAHIRRDSQDTEALRVVHIWGERDPPARLGYETPHAIVI